MHTRQHRFLRLPVVLQVGQRSEMQSCAERRCTQQHQRFRCAVEYASRAEGWTTELRGDRGGHSSISQRTFLQSVQVQQSVRLRRLVLLSTSSLGTSPLGTAEAQVAELQRADVDLANQAKAIKMSAALTAVWAATPPHWGHVRETVGA